MTNTIVVAGGTGNLGGRIIKALLDKGADVRAIVRPDTAEAKVAKLEQQGARVIRVDLEDVSKLTQTLEGASVVVSALSGLRDVIVGSQSLLLKAAIAAEVPRFIPSDYAADFTRLSNGTNRNLDLRREFHTRLDTAPIAATSILNGAFADMLTSRMTPLLDLDAKQVNYFGDADQRLDFTTMDNVAEYTASAALDTVTPPVLRITGMQISPRELANIVSEVADSEFELVRSGSLDELNALIQKERAADPNRDTNVFPRWQARQYLHNMFSGEAKLQTLDNARYPNIEWTGARDLLAKAF